MAFPPDNVIQSCIDHGLNLALTGPHGVGKSAWIESLGERFGLRVVTLHAATMDPHLHFMGIPVPVTVTLPDGRQSHRMHMAVPDAIHSAEILFVDELNRNPDIWNALLQVMNERCLNGEPLTNLRFVATGLNPAGDDRGYMTQDLEPALKSRVTYWYEIEPNPDASIIARITGADDAVVKAAVAWWREQNHAKREAYISPRDLTKIVQVYSATGCRDALRHAMPPDVETDYGKLFVMLERANGKRVATAAGDNQLAAQSAVADKPARVKGIPASFDVTQLQATFASRHVSAPIFDAMANYHSADDLRAVLTETIARWPQPSQSRFRNSFRAFLEDGYDGKCPTGWHPIADAINANTKRASLHIRKA